MRLTVEILLKKHWQREENETGGDCLDRTARRGRRTEEREMTSMTYNQEFRWICFKRRGLGDLSRGGFVLNQGICFGGGFKSWRICFKPGDLFEWGI